MSKFRLVYTFSSSFKVSLAADAQVKASKKIKASMDAFIEKNKLLRFQTQLKRMVSYLKDVQKSKQDLEFLLDTGVHYELQ